MVEHFHPIHFVPVVWHQHLPWVLLGLRTTPKEGIGLSAAEMVFGTTLCLPGEFLAVPEPLSDAFFSDLRQAFKSYAPPPPVHAHVPPSCVDSQLHVASHIFICRDWHVPPLQPLYHGPYLVLQSSALRSPSCFRLGPGPTTSLSTGSSLASRRSLCLPSFPHVEAALLSLSSLHPLLILEAARRSLFLLRLLRDPGAAL